MMDVDRRLDEEGEEEKEKVTMSWSKKKTYKNLVLVCSTFFFVFIAFMGLQYLQSSINCDSALGLASLSIVYITLVISALVSPTVVIRYLGLKYTMAVSTTTYVLYTLANFYPAWSTLVPASLLVGFGASPLWTAQGTYLTTLAAGYARLTGEDIIAVAHHFWGIFFVFLRSCQVVGSIISSVVLQKPGQDTSHSTSHNYTCGAYDCYVESEDSGNKTYCNPPDKQLVYTLLSVYVTSGILAIVTVCFLNNLHISDEGRNQGTVHFCIATIQLMKDYKLILIIPITIAHGLRQAFLFGDFTKSYITCTLGVGWVGYVMISYGVVTAIFSGICGRLVKYTGRVAIFCFGALSYTGILLALLLIKVEDGRAIQLFVISICWGIADAAWTGQLRALYGSLFTDRKESAYSNLLVWESFGYGIAFAYSNFLCIWVKLTILLFIHFIGMIGYAGVEILAEREKVNKRKSEHYDVSVTSIPKHETKSLVQTGGHLETTNWNRNL